MSKCCVSCGSPLPDSHRHRTCSMCYGDPNWGTDGYYRDWLEHQREEQIMKDARRQDEAERYPYDEELVTGVGPGGKE